MPQACSSVSGSSTSCLRLERSILRRWPNAAAVTRARDCGVHGGEGSLCGTSSTTADATLGAGVKASRGTFMTMRGDVRHCASTDKRP